MTKPVPKTSAFLLLLLLAGLSAPCLAQDRGPSTAEERQKALELTQYLEAHPLGKDARDARKWLVVWWASIPDLSVSLCGDYFGPFASSKHKYAAEIVTQMAFSSGAYLIANRETAPDPVSVQLAGLEGALRSYAAIAAQEEQLKDPFLEELAAKKREGTLRAYVETVLPKCK